jgi:hypothetical protein
VNPFYFQIKRTHTTGRRWQRNVEGVELLPAKPDEVLSPLIAITPEAGIEELPRDSIGDLESDMILSVHRLCIPWHALKPPQGTCIWNPANHPDLALANKALFGVVMARRSPARIDLAISAARAVERLVSHAEAFEAKRKSEENYRTAYSCAAALYSEMPYATHGTLFEEVGKVLHPSAQMPPKTASSKWFERWPYRLKAE